MRDLVALLRKQYHSGHSARVSTAIYHDVRAQWPYFAVNYGCLLGLPRSARVLELGSGSGSLLAWLASLGFKDVRGVEVSEQEVLRACAAGLPVTHAEARDYLRDQAQGAFDVVVLKALLEHMSKADGAELASEI